MNIGKHLKAFAMTLLSICVAVSLPMTAFADGNTPAPASTDPTTQTQTTIQPSNSSAAQTGDAVVTANSTAGDATSGDASASATTVTAADSTTGLGNPATQATFTQNVSGNVVGDITLAPVIDSSLQALPPQTSTTQAPTTQPASSNSVNSPQLTVVSAASGNATVTNNGTAGNATTGNANAVANSITVANTSLISQGAYIGTINIYGNLDGDILISPGFSPQVVTPVAASSNMSALDPASTNNTDTVTNVINLSATSGDATVSNNSTAGNATTGGATTNVVALGIINQQLSAQNGILIFVNVLGTWDGTIVNEPAGTTTADLATGILQANSLSPAKSTNSVTIANTINVTAQTGNALVANNSTAGNATSGKATASANVLTLVGDIMKFTGWFGILFINVYGNWSGSFGIDTSHGNPVPPLSDPMVDPPAVQISIPVPHATHMAALVTHSSKLAASPINYTPPSSESVDPPAQTASVLGEMTNTPAPTPDPSSYPFTLYVLMAAAAALLLTLIIYRLLKRSST